VRLACCGNTYLGDLLTMPRRFLAQRSFFAGWLARTLPFLRDRMLADPRFLFIVCAEVGIDSGARR